MRNHLVLMLMAVVLGLIPTVRTPVLHADTPPTVAEIGGILMCQCGCGLTVMNCQGAMTCSVSDGIMKQIQDQVDAGKGKQEILDYFAAAYGPGILALPSKSGFGLAAWTTPFLLIAAGAILVGGLMWFWARRRPVPAPAGAATTTPAQLSAYEKRVDDDLRSMD